MATKVKKFKSKPIKGLKKRIKLSGAKTEKKLLTKRINSGHRLIKKSRERKLKSLTPTVLSSAHKKYIKAL